MSLLSCPFSHLAPSKLPKCRCLAPSKLPKCRYFRVPLPSCGLEVTKVSLFVVFSARFATSKLPRSLLLCAFPYETHLTGKKNGSLDSCCMFSDVLSILNRPRALFNSLALSLDGCLWQRQSAMHHVRCRFLYIYIYILDSHMAPYGACGVAQSTARSNAKFEAERF